MVASENIDINSQSGLVWAVASYSGIALGILMMALANVRQIAVEWHAQPAQIGNLFAVELAAMIMATIVSWFWLSRVNWCCVAFIATLLFISGNLASDYMPVWQLFMLVCFIAAFCAGTLMIITIARGEQTRFA